MAKMKTAQPVKAVGSTATKKPKIGEIETSYRVTSEGYSEDFEVKHAAMEQAAFLKKRGIKNQEEFTISVKEIVDGKPGKEIHKVAIKEEFYK